MNYTTELVISATVEVRELFETQKNFAQKLRLSSVEERIAKLRRLEKQIIAYQDRICQAVFDDFRKHPTETLATEVFLVLSDIKHTISHLRKWTKPKSVATPLPLFGTSSYIHYEPKGVCLIISPWNYPFQLAISPLVSAIAAGNCAMIKPSEMTPNTSKVLADLVRETFAKEEIALIEGGVETTTELLALPFNHIFFTGSPAVGKIVMAAAAKHLTSVTLELGGKSPVIIDETPDFELIAERLVWGKLVNNGQTCIAPDYVFVPKNKEKELVAALEKAIQKMYNSQGKGIENETSYCRIVNTRHFQRINQLIADSVEKGAKIAIGGKLDMNDRFISPTVLTDLKPDMNIMQEEIFGPVLPILTYTNLSEALQFINANEKPLALYIFSKNKENIQHILDHTSAGGTTINDCMLHISNPDLPFGGVNNSGIGKTHGFYGFKEFSNERAVLRQKYRWTSVSMLYPPYTPKVRRLIDWLMKFF